ncbi:MAG: hypothetical protein FWF08_04170, partial [Oscillospiraceae bacterium]|nr:hypothetical protein [Oscillospiraceae bacterium]
MKKLYIILSLLIVSGIAFGVVIYYNNRNADVLQPGNHISNDSLEDSSIHSTPPFVVDHNFNYYDEMINWINEANPDKISFKDNDDESAEIIDYYEKSFVDTVKVIKNDSNILLPFYKGKEAPLVSYDTEGLYNIYFSSNFLYNLPGTYYHVAINNRSFVITVVILDNN